MEPCCDENDMLKTQAHLRCALRNPLRSRCSLLLLRRIREGCKTYRSSLHAGACFCSLLLATECALLLLKEKGLLMSSLFQEDGVRQMARNYIHTGALINFYYSNCGLAQLYSVSYSIPSRYLWLQ